MLRPEYRLDSVECGIDIDKDEPVQVWNPDSGVRSERWKKVDHT